MLRKLRELDKLRPIEQYLKVMSIRKRNKTSQDLTQDLRDPSDPAVDPYCSLKPLLKNGLSGRVDLTKLFLMKGNGKKRLSNYTVLD